LAENFPSATQNKVVNGPCCEARTRSEPEPGPSPTFIFEARFRTESQIYRVSQDKHNCGVSKNVVYVYSCKCTPLSHRNQHNGLNKHELSLLVNDNAAVRNVSQEKNKLSRNYPRRRYRRKITSSIGPQAWKACLWAIVSWNKPKIVGVIDLFDAMPSPANFLTAVAFSKECETNPSREQKNAAVFANRISWRKITITSLTEVTAVRTTNVPHERKKMLFWIKKFFMQARNRPEKFWQT